MYADFHALRHTYLTLGGRAGIDLRTLQELAGHSTSKLTERYTHVRLRDLAGAVEKMPSFLPSSPILDAAWMKASGTDGAIPDSAGTKIAYTLLTPESGGEAGRSIEGDGGGLKPLLPSACRKSLETKEVDGEERSEREPGGKRPHRCSEPDPLIRRQERTCCPREDELTHA